MNNVALYRKYRPHEFDEVRGQDHVVKALQGALEQNHIGHAYLFTGGRGTGKTSVARIFARAVGTHDTDLYEIDAASNRGVDDVRALRDAVVTLPFHSPYKVYIIDEAHMLTKEASNALLKTLEEPPAHVIFILATTELHKILDTIVSRCEVHTFKQPTRQMLKDHIVSVAKKEGFTLEHAAGDLIALLAEGSFRDANGILQKILYASKDKKVSIEEVSLITSAPRGEYVNDIVMSLQTGEPKKGLDALHKASNEGVDMNVLSKLLLEKLRAVLLLRYAPDMKQQFSEEFLAEDITLLEECATAQPPHITSATLLRFLDVHTAISRAYLPHLPLELAIIDSTTK
jgi:DNA polymerase-3 subunit gamma/tau